MKFLEECDMLDPIYEKSADGEIVNFAADLLKHEVDPRKLHIGTDMRTEDVNYTG